MKRLLTASAVLALLFAATAPARAGIIFSDFGSGQSCSNVSYNVSSTSVMAQSFTPNADYTLTSLSLALWLNTGPDSAIVSLCADNAGVPGSILESFIATSLTATSAVYTFMETPGVQLHQGTQYWVVVGGPGMSSSTVVAWNENVTSTRGFTSSMNGGTTWNAFGTPLSAAFEVDGQLVSPTPEPTSLGLLAVGAAGMLGYGWKRRRRGA